MESLQAWFNALPLAAKVLATVLGAPVAFFAVGLAVILVDLPGESFWGERPRWWEVVWAITLIGFFASLVLGAIFGSSFFFWGVLDRVGWGNLWMKSLAFLVSLALVLVGTVAGVDLWSRRFPQEGSPD